MDDEFWETAARLYCQMAGLDPDFMVPCPPHPSGHMVYMQQPQWKTYAPLMLMQYRFDVAIGKTRMLPTED